MKRIAACFLCLMMICALAAPVRAAGTSVTIQTDKTTLSPGDQFTLTVSFAAGETVSTVAMKLTYDSNVLEVVDGQVDTSTGPLVSGFNGSGFALMYNPAGTYSGNMGTVTLRVKSGAAAGTTTISGTPVFKNGANVLDAACNELTITIAANGNPSQPSQETTAAVPAETVSQGDTAPAVTVPAVNAPAAETTNKTGDGVQPAADGGAENGSPLWWILLAVAAAAGAALAVIFIVRKRKK